MNSIKGLINPETVALCGASEQSGTANASVTHHLLCGAFASKTFLVNPRQKKIYGETVYASIGDIDQDIETVVIVVPPQFVASTLRDAYKKGVQNAIIITDLAKSGYEDECKEVVRDLSSEMIITGPNSLGIFSYRHQFVAGFFREYEMLNPGHVTVVAQSGGIGIEVLEKCQGALNHVLTIGNAEGAAIEDVLEALIDDETTDAVGIYLESYRDPAKFLSIVRMLADRKPVVILHPSKSSIAQKAVSSHTGALTGDYKVFEAMARIAGVLLVESLSDFTLMIRFFDSSVARKNWKHHPSSTQVTILENAGGQGAAFTNVFEDFGISAPELSAEWVAKLREVVPSNGSCRNPIDIIGTADAKRYTDTLRIVLDIDGICFISFTPTQILQPEAVSREIVACCESYIAQGKMVFVVWSGEAKFVEPGIAILREAGIYASTEGDELIRIIGMFVQYLRAYDRLHETVKYETYQNFSTETAPSSAKNILESARGTIVDEYASKCFADAYGLPVVRTLHAGDVGDAVEMAECIGHPVVVKLISDTATHKSEYGVHLNVQTSDAVRAACVAIQAKTPEEDFGGFSVQKMVGDAEVELCVGATCNPVVGPVVMAGAGGKYMETMNDVGVSISPPFMTNTLANAVWQRTNIWKVMHSKRLNLPMKAFDDIRYIIQKVNVIMRRHPEIKDIEFNPILVDGEGNVTIVDARILLHEKDAHIPQPVLRSVPWEYTKRMLTKQQEEYQISPILPIHHEPLMSMHASLEPETIYNRYQHAVSFDVRIRDLERRVNFDYDRRFALVAMMGERAVGVVRVEKTHDYTAEISLLVADDMQNKGIGRALLAEAVDFADEESDINLLIASTKQSNARMVRLFRDAGFETLSSEGGDIEFGRDCSPTQTYRKVM